jgi:hypothetical protein
MGLINSPDQSWVYFWEKKNTGSRLVAVQQGSFRKMLWADLQTCGEISGSGFRGVDIG